MKQRKPDMETESMRVWSVKDKEKSYYEKMSKDASQLKVKTPDGEVVLLDFVQLKRKNGDKTLFAYKFKANEMMMLYIDLSETPEEKAEVEKLMVVFKELCGNLGVPACDARDTIKSALNESESIDQRVKLREKRLSK